jgi:HAD superfamily hydrolase (TIGR01509 family)
MGQMGVAPEACVVIEDSVPGVAAARAAGIPALGFCGVP